MAVKTSKKVISIILAVLMAASVVAVFGTGSLFRANAAAGDMVYLEAPDSWSTPYCYMWIKGTTNGNHSWPGEAMTRVEGNIWSYQSTGDGEVKMDDVLLIQAHIAKIRTLDANQQLAANVVTSDDEINLQDVLQIQKYIAKIISEL
ncbi:MAG: starch-binding protein [Acutalibacteraceae bacterium]